MDLLDIITLILGAGGGLIITLEILMEHPPTRRLKRKKGGKWEMHPCVLPERAGITSEGTVWACKCGRRWKYIKFSKEEYPYTGKRIWQERTPEMDLADAEKELKKTLKEK